MHESVTRKGEIRSSFERVYGFVFFIGTDVEVLTVGSCILLREDQDPRLRQDYKNAFSPD